jgi:hypothetical protein
MKQYFWKARWEICQSIKSRSWPLTYLSELHLRRHLLAQLGSAVLLPVRAHGCGHPLVCLQPVSSCILHAESVKARLVLCNEEEVQKQGTHRGGAKDGPREDGNQFLSPCRQTARSRRSTTKWSRPPSVFRKRHTQCCGPRVACAHLLQCPTLPVLDVVADVVCRKVARSCLSV